MAGLTGTRSMITNNVAVGGTADTFDAVGNFDLDDHATAILGFWHTAGKAAVTTVEAEHAQMRVFVGSRLIGPWGVGPVFGAGPATNEGGQCMKPQFFPRAIPQNVQEDALAGLNVAFEFSSHIPDPTNAYSVVEGVLLWRGPPDLALMKAVQDSAKIGCTLPFDNCDAEANGAVTTTAAAITDLVLRDNPQTVVGFELDWAVDAAPTAGAESVGWIDFTSSISGFDTQQYPLPGRSAALGTAVEVEGNGNLIYYAPAWIPAAGAKQQTITPTVRLNATVDASGVGASVFWI